MNPIEESGTLQLDFSKLDKVGGKGMAVIPVAVQNADTREVIMLAYVNKEALDLSLKTRTATFWSTSRNKLHIKGATSGETFEVVEVRVNCEQNSLLYVVRPRRDGICHTKNRLGQPRNCFYRRLVPNTLKLVNLDP